MRTLPQKIYDTVLRIKPDVLNNRPADAPAPTIVQNINTCMKKIKAATFDAQGVCYDDLRHSEYYARFRELTAQLQHYELAQLISREQRLAFWINIYNFLMLDAILYYDIQTSVTEKIMLFDQANYNIGGYLFSLNNIEHGILRANTGYILTLGQSFPKGDVRQKFALAQRDFRIHFALNCGAVSCPPINIYHEEQIDQQLDLATQSFINSPEFDIHMETKTAQLSRILQWFGADFGAGRLMVMGIGDKSHLLRTLAPYLADKKVRDFVINHADEFNVTFKPYQWKLNAV